MNTERNPITAQELREWREAGRKVTPLRAYRYAVADGNYTAGALEAIQSIRKLAAAIAEQG